METIKSKSVIQILQKEIDLLNTENKELTDFIYASNFMKAIRDKSR